MSAPAITVIVPIYNVEAYISECLRSLLAQTFEDFEVVCVDDGSPDDSVAIARRTVQGDRRFRFVAQANAGLSAARNRGIEEANGAYLLFLDSDDYYVPECLELLYLTARADELDYLDFTAHTFYEAGDIKRTNNEDGFECRSDIAGVMSGPDLFVEYLRRGEYHCPACFHFFERSLLDRANLRFVEGIIHEDELFSPLLLAHARKAAFLNVALYQRRMRSDSIMTAQRGLRNIDSLLFVTRELETWLREHVGDGVYDDAFARAWAQRIAFLRNIIVNDADTVPEDALGAYGDGLSEQALVDFELYVRGGQKIREEINSRINRLYLSAKKRLPRK